jgi:hypothetical protein
MEFFKKELFKCGDKLKKTDSPKWKFELKDEVTIPIEYVHTGCGCTKLKSIENGVVEGIITVNTAGTFNEENDSFTKTIVVYFDDGKPEFIRTEIGQRVVNKEKSKQVLTIVGTVEID